MSGIDWKTVQVDIDKESGYKKRPLWLPKGSETMPVIASVTEEEARNLPQWMEQEGGIAGANVVTDPRLIPTSTPRITKQEMLYEMRGIPIRVKEGNTVRYYRELDPVSGGKKGTEVDWEDYGYTPAGGMPKISLPEIPKIPGWKFPSFPKIGLPKINVGLPEISGAAKAGIGLTLLFIGGIILLLAIGYSGMGESVGRVGEREHKRKRK